MRSIKKLIVHCSDTPNNSDITVGEIRKWHTSPDPNDSSKPWSDIGYHYVIYRNGKVMQGRPVIRIGSHCKGQNRNSIGVCLVGRDQFTPEQFDSLRNLYRTLRNIFQDMQLYGHRDFSSNKTCPNFEAKSIFKG